MFDKNWLNFCELIKRSKLNRKSLYHFVVFAIIEILIKKDRQMSVSVRSHER